MSWVILAIAVIVLYLSWFVVISIWSRLIELGVEHKKSFISFFDAVLGSGLLGLFFARIVWMFSNMSLFTSVPWGIVPYVRSASGIAWFSVFPWRFLLFSEGIFYPVLWGIWGLSAIIMLYVPTLVLIGKLRIDKKNVMRMFRRNVFLGIIAVLLVTVLAIYFSVN